MPEAARCETLSRDLYDCIDAATKGNHFSISEFFGKRIRINGGNFTLETTISDVVLRLGGLGREREQAICLTGVDFLFAETKVLVNKGRWKLPRTIIRMSFAPRRRLPGLLLLLFEDDGHGDKEVSVDLLD